MQHPDKSAALATDLLGSLLLDLLLNTPNEANTHLRGGLLNACPCSAYAGYVQELNMHASMYNALTSSLNWRDQVGGQLSGADGAARQQQLQQAGFTKEATLVGRMLQRDFEKSGVHMDSRQQQQLADVTMHVHDAGARFGVHS